MLYTFAIHNWKADNAKAFWIKKEFPSAYAADRWASRLTFKVKNNPYIVVFCAGLEK